MNTEDAMTYEAANAWWIAALKTRDDAALFCRTKKAEAAHRAAYQAIADRRQADVIALASR